MTSSLPTTDNTTHETLTPARTDLLGFTLTEMAAWLAERGQPAFRAKQLTGWIYTSLVPDFAAMRNLPAGLREQLEREASIAGPQVRTEVKAKDGRTRKLLLELADGRLIETVLMLYPANGESRARATVCVSTQAGCAYGCTFWRRCCISPASYARSRGSHPMAKRLTA